MELPPAAEHRQHYVTLAQEAIHVAWQMLTLVPPAFLCSPETNSPHWQDVEGSKQGQRFCYYKPMMLYCAHSASVGVKGIISFKDTLPGDYETGMSDCDKGQLCTYNYYNYTTICMHITIQLYACIVMI